AHRYPTRSIPPAWMLVTGLAFSMAAATRARAAEPSDGTRLALFADPSMPEPTETPAPVHGGPAVQEPVRALEEERAVRPADVHSGGGARLRWASVPAWLLDAFTKRNVPLSSWGTGIELFRRKGNFDFVLSFNYQNMSPSDGNWLGTGHMAAIDTDYV